MAQPEPDRPWTPPGPPPDLPPGHRARMGRTSPETSAASWPTAPYSGDWSGPTPPDVLPMPPLFALRRLDRWLSYARQTQAMPVSTTPGEYRGHYTVVTHYRGRAGSDSGGRIRFESQLAALEVPVECTATRLTPRRGVGRLRYWFGARDRSLPRVLTDHYNVDTRDAAFAREVFGANVSRWLVAHPEATALPLYFEGRWMSCMLPSPPDPPLARRQLEFLADVHERLWPRQ